MKTKTKKSHNRRKRRQAKKVLRSKGKFKIGHKRRGGRTGSSKPGRRVTPRRKQVTDDQSPSGDTVAVVVTTTPTPATPEGPAFGGGGGDAGGAGASGSWSPDSSGGSDNSSSGSSSDGNS